MKELPFVINKLNEELVYLLGFHAYINEMHDSRGKIPSRKSRTYMYIYVKFLALLWAPYIYDISRLRLKIQFVPHSKPYVSVIKTNTLMLYGEIIAVYSEIHTQHTQAFCGKNVGFFKVKRSGTYNNQ
jgi:hypothetical protein